MPETLVDRFAEVLAETERLIRAVADGEWTAATPCAGWTVHDLVNHLVAGNRLFVEVLAGNPPPLEEIRRRAVADQLGDAPPIAFRESADALLAAFRVPGALDRSVRTPIGTVPAAAALHLRITEALVHSWDLARATGRAVDFPDDLVEQELAFSRARLGDVEPGRAPFGPAQPVPDDAPALDRLAGCLGRAVTAWPAAPRGVREG